MRELEKLLDAYKDAIYQKDLNAFTALFDENVRVFDMWESWSYYGLQAWQGMVTGWFASLGTDKDVVAFEEVQTETSGDLAVVTAFARFTAVSEQGESLRYLDNRLTLVLRKFDEGWKITHQHTSGPIDFQTMKIMLQR